MTRWSWFFLASGIGVTCAEALAWSTPIIYPVGLFVLVVYGLHYLLIVDYLAGKQALTLRALAVGGFVVGITTESLLTKVIWNPPWNEEEAVRIAGLGVYEVGFIVLVWHAWISMAVPFALALTVFGHAEILTPQQVRRILLALPLTMWMCAAINGPGLVGLALIGTVLNAAGILLSAWFYQWRAARHPHGGPVDFRLKRKERRIVWGLILALYGIGLTWRPEAYPTVGPFVLGMLLLVGGIALLIAVGHADQGKTPPACAPVFTTRKFLRYAAYFTLASTALIGLALITMPVSTWVTLCALLLLILPGDGYMLRLAWRVRRPALS
jgi:hypothetical protein